MEGDMPNMMDRGMAVHSRLMPIAAGDTVIYSRGSRSSSAITAWSGPHKYEVLDPAGELITQVLARDWTFIASELLIDATAIIPRSGDRIAVTLNGSAVGFEVLPMGPEPCCEWLDTGHTMLLVRTKQVG